LFRREVGDVAGHIIVEPQQRQSYLAGCVSIVEQVRRATWMPLDFAITADLIDPAPRNSVCGFHAVSSMISWLTMTRIRTVSQRGQYQQSNSGR